MYYKYVEFPNLEEIAETVFYNIPDSYKIIGGFRDHIPEVFQKCKPLVEGLKSFTVWDNVKNIAVITVTPNGGYMPVHTDFGMSDFPYSLNLPIANCGLTSYTCMYKVLPGRCAKTTQRDDTNGSNYNHYDFDDVEEVERFYLTKPAFFNTSIPHSVHNHGTEQRVILSVRFKEAFDF
jgi:hypothetical protein